MIFKFYLLGCLISNWQVIIRIKTTTKNIYRVLSKLTLIFALQPHCHKYHRNGVVQHVLQPCTKFRETGTAQWNLQNICKNKKTHFELRVNWISFPVVISLNSLIIPISFKKPPYVWYISWNVIFCTGIKVFLSSWSIRSNNSL